MRHDQDPGSGSDCLAQRFDIHVKIATVKIDRNRNQVMVFRPLVFTSIIVALFVFLRNPASAAEIRTFQQGVGGYSNASDLSLNFAGTNLSASFPGTVRIDYPDAGWPGVPQLEPAITPDADARAALLARLRSAWVDAGAWAAP